MQRANPPRRRSSVTILTAILHLSDGFLSENAETSKERGVLINVEVSNHRSILEPVELSMIAIDEDRPGARWCERLGRHVLTTAGIYGANASGKSNVLSAIAWLVDSIGRVWWEWGPGVPRNAHRYGQGPDLPSEFRIDVLAEGVRYQYHLAVSDDRVEFEALYSFPERRRRRIFEREDMATTFRRGTERVRGIRELLTPTTLVLSAGSRLGTAEMRIARDAIHRINAGTLAAGVKGRQHALLGYSATGLFGDDYEIGVQADQREIMGPSEADQPDHEPRQPDPNLQATALHLMQLADPSISGATWHQSRHEIAEGASGRQLRFRHRAGDSTAEFSLGEESQGTQRWFETLGAVLWQLRFGGTLLVDELDASLHPRITKRVLEAFRDPVTNPLGAQLIFTTHDTSLLGTLNRDEVWLTDKDATGATTLYALADFEGERVRKSLNLERAYLQGRFGAVPSADQAALYRMLDVPEIDDDPDGTPANERMAS